MNNSKIRQHVIEARANWVWKRFWNSPALAAHFSGDMFASMNNIFECMEQGGMGGWLMLKP